MQRIYKYPLCIQDELYIPMPRGARVLSVQVQFGEPVVWALVETEREVVKHWFFVLGTGHPIKFGIGDATFVDTIQLREGALVFHVFDNGETH